METPKVGFVEAFKLYWTNYVNFKGRSRRSEYWWVMLWHLIITIPALFLGVVLMFIPVLGWIVAVILFLAIGSIWTRNNYSESRINSETVS
ncbi:DUF805 domain-containing protein [Staphylococcus pseudintermedius]